MIRSSSISPTSPTKDREHLLCSDVGMKQIRCSVKYFCIGALLIFVGSILLCALGFTIVLPHEATSDWPRVMCNVTHSGYNVDFCSCTEQAFEYEDCINSYPCLQVYVTSHALPPSSPHHRRRHDHHNREHEYRSSSNVTSGGSDSDVLVQLDSEQGGGGGGSNAEGEGGRSDSLGDVVVGRKPTGMLYRSWSDVFYNECSLHECGVEEWNVAQSRSFRKLWGRVGQSYPCYYDPRAPYVFILETVPYDHMVHAVLWPTLCLLSGTLMWLGLWLGCWTIELEQKYTYPQRTYGVGMIY